MTLHPVAVARPTQTGGEMLLFAAVAGLAVGAVVHVAVNGVHDDHAPLAAIFIGLIVVGQVLPVRAPNGRVLAPIATAAAGGYALHGYLPNAPEHASYWTESLAVFAIGTAIGLVPHLLARRPLGLEGLVRRFFMLVVTVGLLEGLDRLGNPADWGMRFPLLALGVLAAIMGVAVVIDVVTWAAIRAVREPSPQISFVAALRAEREGLLIPGLAVAVMALVLASSTNLIGVTAIPLFSVPLVLTHLSFRRVAASRRTYAQTIHALSRATEIAGYTESGHAARVAGLAAPVGSALGLSERELHDLEFAALLHDLGQISLDEPIPGGATTLLSLAEQRHVASLGAEVVRQTGVLDEVARIIERQAEPYRRTQPTPVSDVPTASRIIKAVNAFDDLVGASPSPWAAFSALERLRLGVGDEFDPRVVDALGRLTQTTFGSLHAAERIRR